VGNGLICLENVSKSYRMGEVDVHALRPTELTIEAGELLAILGPSGSGKSTLLNLLGGLDHPTTGAIRFGERDLASASERELTLFRRHNIGFVFQFFNLVPTLTALENVQVAVEIAEQPLPAAEALRLVGLEQRAQHFPSQLSGGEQQRVAIARALATNPRLLLCDEPTGNLDSATGRMILELLWDVNQRLGMTVVIITHSLAVAAMADRVATLRDGRLVSLQPNSRKTHPRDLEL